MIEHKALRGTDDRVCAECSQQWEGDCRAGCMPHNDAERESRKDGRMLCLRPESRLAWAGRVRSIFQHRLDLDKPEIVEALDAFCGIHGEELQALRQLADWICNHGLENTMLLRGRPL